MTEKEFRRKAMALPLTPGVYNMKKKEVQRYLLQEPRQ